MTRRTSRLLRHLRAVAERHADAPAMTFLRSDRPPAAYTYGQLFARAEEIAGRLAGLDVIRTGPLGLLLSTQEDQVLHYLAALAAGAVPAVLTPPNRKLDRRYYLDTMSAVLDRSQFAAVVSDVDGLQLQRPTLSPHTLARRTPAPSTTPDPAGVRSVRPGVPFLQFSSGTTGFKRGVVVRDEAVLSQLQVYGRALRLRPDDRIVSWLPLYHDMGFIACLNLPLAHGLATVMLDPIDWVTEPARWLHLATRHRATLAWNPNFAYAFMADRVPDAALEGVDLSSLRRLVNCSEPVTLDAQRRFSDRFRPVGLPASVFTGCYAMAETTFALTHGEPDAPGTVDPVGPEGAAVPGGSAHVSVGRPLPGVELRVVDDRGRPLPDRRIGELWVRSPFTCDGYHNDVVATTAAFTDGWYRTGDLGYRVEDRYHVVGRKKDVLVVGGSNVFPQDIEELVSQVPGVLPGRVAAFSTPDERLQTERIVVLAESSAADDRTIVVEARRRLLAALQIGNFTVQLVPPGWLVKSSSGKMARAQSRRRWEALGGRVPRSPAPPVAAARSTEPC